MSQNETVVSSCDLNYFKHLFLSSLYTYYETCAAGQSVAYSSEKPLPASGLQKMRKLVKRTVMLDTYKAPTCECQPSRPDPCCIVNRNDLRETLLDIANDADDLMVSSAEVKHTALSIEEEIFQYYGKVNSLYVYEA